MAEDDLNELFGDSEEEEELGKGVGPRDGQGQPSADAEEGAAPQLAGVPADAAPPSAERPWKSLADRFGPVGELEGLEDDVEVGAAGEAPGEGEEGPQGAAAPTGPPLTLAEPLVEPPGSAAVRLVKLPNLLRVEPKPYSAATYAPADDCEAYRDGAGVERERVRSGSVLRWRLLRQPDGSLQPQSNTRLVRWSDGSEQLFVGDEVFDVAENGIAADNAHLFVRHPQLIQAQGQLLTKLAFRPASLDSRVHRAMLAATSRRHTKVQRVQKTATISDPAKEKSAREKQEEERIRSREVLDRRREKEMRRYNAPSLPQPRQAPSHLTAAYLEQEDDEDGFIDDDGGGPGGGSPEELRRGRDVSAQEELEMERRLTAMKRTEAPRGQPPGEGGPSGARPPASKRQRPVGSSDEEEEEEAPARGRLKGVTVRKGVVLSDDEDD